MYKHKVIKGYVILVIYGFIGTSSLHTTTGLTLLQTDSTLSIYDHKMTVRSQDKYISKITVISTAAMSYTSITYIIL